MFSCEICEISKNTFFTEHVWMTVPALESYGIDSLIQNIFKVISEGISNNDNKGKQNCFQKRDVDPYLQKYFYSNIVDDGKNNFYT